MFRPRDFFRPGPCRRGRKKSTIAVTKGLPHAASLDQLHALVIPQARLSRVGLIGDIIPVIGSMQTLDGVNQRRAFSDVQLVEIVSLAKQHGQLGVMADIQPLQPVLAAYQFSQLDTCADIQILETHSRPPISRRGVRQSGIPPFPY